MHRRELGAFFIIDLCTLPNPPKDDIDNSRLVRKNIYSVQQCMDFCSSTPTCVFWSFYGFPYNPYNPTERLCLISNVAPSPILPLPMDMLAKNATGGIISWDKSCTNATGNLRPVHFS